MAPLYALAPAASEVVATVGAATAFFAATIAIAQTDIKKVLAYSTVSQLGFMFVAAGVGAYGVAIFHVYTHAFFKACLFLGSGSVIHALGGEQDIRKMGGLARKIPWTFATFLVATAAIAGIPPLAGFWSKDEILWFAFGSSKGGGPLLWAVMAATALLTAFYMFRLLWLTFLGRSRMDKEVEHHVHESPWSMVGVLVVLGIASAVGGFFDLPHFLTSLPLPEPRPHAHELEMPLLWISIAIAAAGLLLAWLFFGRDAERAGRVAPSFAGLSRILYNKYFVDEAYDRLLARPLWTLSESGFLRIGDRLLIDGTLNGLARLAHRAGGALGRVQTGNLHLYVLFVVAGLVLAIAWGLAHA
jgi:NADH-quinone oxidoreductase subunit L